MRVPEGPPKATISPLRKRDLQKIPASFRIAKQDLKDPAFQCRKLAVSAERADLKGHGKVFTKLPCSHAHQAPNRPFDVFENLNPT